MGANLPSISTTEALIMDLLREGERFGLELVDQSGGTLKRGSVYVILARMEAKGFVTSRLDDRPPPARRDAPAVFSHRLRRAGPPRLRTPSPGARASARDGAPVTARLVDWLGRSLLHERTVALIVEPALADLSFETAGPRRRRAQARLGPWVAFALAIWHDLVWDPRGPAWGRSARVLASLALVVAGVSRVDADADAWLRHEVAHRGQPPAVGGDVEPDGCC